MVMEKQNVIEDGRTPEAGIKIAAAVEEAAVDLQFDEFKEEPENNEPTREDSD